MHFELSKAKERQREQHQEQHARARKGSCSYMHAAGDLNTGKLQKEEHHLCSHFEKDLQAVAEEEEVVAVAEEEVVQSNAGFLLS